MPRRSTTVLVGLGLVAACYRDPPPVASVGLRPLVMASCSTIDDLHHAPVDPNPGGRLRTHTTGSLAGAAGRSWTGGQVPSFVPLKVGTLELFLLDEADGGYLAFYREPYGLGSCGLGGSKNCAYGVRFYDGSHQLAWKLKLDKLMARPDHLEIQDIRLADGVLYYNEACQSYSSGAGGQCSMLVALDPRAGRVLWRTRPLVSNGRFRIRGCYVVAGYGFTNEPDFVFLVERATGKVLQELPVATAPEQMTLIGPDRLDIELYSGTLRRFRLDGIESRGGRLVALDPPEQFGGASYGGASYGGASYGLPPPRRR
jgi:hypothetical protein